MTRDFIKFEEGNDTGDNLSESIAPVEAGDAASPQDQNRPLDVLRARTEVLRAACDNALFLAAEDRALAITCPGALHWGGPFDPTLAPVADEDALDGYTGRIGIGGDLHVVSLTTPNSTIFSSLQHTDIKFTTRKTAADGGRQVSIEIEDTTDVSVLTLTVTGTPKRHLLIQFDSGTSTPTVQEVFDALTDTADSAFNAEASALILPEITGTAGNPILELSKIYLVPGWDFEYHVIHKGVLDAFFNIDDNRLAEGDNLCLRFNTLLDRRQSLKDGTPSDGISVSPVTEPNVTETALVVGRNDTSHLENAIPLAKVDGGNLVLMNGVPLRPGHFWAPEGAQFSDSVSHTAREIHVRTVTLATFEISGGTIPKRHLLRTYLNTPRKRALKGNVVIIAGGAYYVEGQHFVVDSYRDSILQLVEFASAMGNVYFREMPDIAENLGASAATMGPPAALIGLDTRFFERHPDRDRMIDVQSALERLVITAVTVAEAAALSSRLEEVLGVYYSPIAGGRTVLNMGSLTGVRRMQAPTEMQTQYWQEYSGTRPNLWELGGRVLSPKQYGIVADGEALTDVGTLVPSGAFPIPSDLSATEQDFGANWATQGKPGTVDLATQIAAIQFGEAISGNALADKWRALVTSGSKALALTELRDYPMPVTVSPTGSRSFGLHNATHYGDSATVINAAVATARSRGLHQVFLMPGEYTIDAAVDAPDIDFIGIGSEDNRPIVVFDSSNMLSASFTGAFAALRLNNARNLNFAFKSNGTSSPNLHGIFETDANLISCIGVRNWVKECSFTSYDLRTNQTDLLNGGVSNGETVIFRQISAIIGDRYKSTAAPSGFMRADTVFGLFFPKVQDCFFLGMFMGIPTYSGTHASRAFIDLGAEEGDSYIAGWECSWYHQAMIGGFWDLDWLSSGTESDMRCFPLDLVNCGFVTCGVVIDSDEPPAAGSPTNPFEVDLDAGPAVAIQGMSIMAMARRVHQCTFRDVLINNRCEQIPGNPATDQEYDIAFHSALGLMAAEIVGCEGGRELTPVGGFGVHNGINFVAKTVHHAGPLTFIIPAGGPFGEMWAFAACMRDNHFDIIQQFEDETASTNVTIGAFLPSFSAVWLDPAFRALALEEPVSTIDGAPYVYGMHSSGMVYENNQLSLAGVTTSGLYISANYVVLGANWLRRMGLDNLPGGPPAIGDSPVNYISVRDNFVRGIRTDDYNGASNASAHYTVAASAGGGLNKWADPGGDSLYWMCVGVISHNYGFPLLSPGPFDSHTPSGYSQRIIRDSDIAALTLDDDFWDDSRMKSVSLDYELEPEVAGRRNTVLIGGGTGRTLDLPPDAPDGTSFIIKAISAGPHTIDCDPLSGGTIKFEDGVTTTLANDAVNDIIEVIREGDRWYVLNVVGWGLTAFDITVQEDGSNIPNTPHSTLNFTQGVLAEDGGAGVATILGSLIKQGSSVLASDTTTTSGTPVTLHSFSYTKLRADSLLMVIAIVSASNDNNDKWIRFRLLIGASVECGAAIVGKANEGNCATLITVASGLAAGSHTLLVDWATEANTAQCQPATTDYEECKIFALEILI